MSNFLFGHIPGTEFQIRGLEYCQTFFARRNDRIEKFGACDETSYTWQKFVLR